MPVAGALALAGALAVAVALAGALALAVALGLGVQLKVRGQPPYFLLLGFMYMVSCFLKTMPRFIKTC